MHSLYEFTICIHYMHLLYAFTIYIYYMHSLYAFTICIHYKHSVYAFIDVTLLMSLCWFHSVDVTLLMSLCWCHSVDVTLLMSLCWCHSVDVTLLMSLCWCHSVDVTPLVEISFTSWLTVGYLANQFHIYRDSTLKSVAFKNRGVCMGEGGRRGCWLTNERSGNLSWNVRANERQKEKNCIQWHDTQTSCTLSKLWIGTGGKILRKVALFLTVTLLVPLTLTK